MSVGGQASTATINQDLTAFSVELRELMRKIANMSEEINGQGTGLATLQAIGFGSAANPANPGGVSDAQYALNTISYLNTIAGVYFGQVAQTPAFNFDNALSSMWAGE